MHFEDIATKKKLRKKDLKMESKAPTKKSTNKVDKTKNTLSIYTYLNFKRFGLAVAIDNGIKITVLWFETHIKFEKK
jgi:hypothetical protein